MRLLLVNANTSQTVTDAMAREARAAAAPTTTIRPVTGTFGAEIIASRSEAAIAEHMALTLMAQYGPGYDGVLVGVSFDSGVRAGRELLSIPVVGMTEAALLTACMLGGRIGVVVPGRRVLPLFRELVAGYGLESRMAGYGVLEGGVPYDPEALAAYLAPVVTVAEQLVEGEGAEVVVLAGAALAGLHRRLQEQLPVPLVDGIDCGVRQLELLVHLRAPKPQRGSYAPLEQRRLQGVDPALVAALGPRGDGPHDP